MQLDEILSQMQQDMDASLSQINNSLQETYNPIIGADRQVMFCPECGTRIDNSFGFCPECGTRIINQTSSESITMTQSSLVPFDGDIQENEDCHKEGILFTNIDTLSQKYKTTRIEVEEIFNRIINQSIMYGIHWRLLDVSNDGLDDFWLDYNERISTFMQTEGLLFGMKTHLFIIGGDDVIPIPKVEDTFGTSDDGQMPCDMCYAFTGNFFSDLWDGGDRQISENFVRNTVARLPLEDGDMASSIEDDLVSYFNLCTLYYRDGIGVNGVLMASNASWLPASRTMSEHLPLINHSDDEAMTKDDMYVCPPVEVSDEDSLRPLNVSMDLAGMLLFNLHGAKAAGMSGFYHDEGEAFCVEMLGNTNARVLNTVACYGARYHGYERDDSMILNALYNNGILLYAGSLIPVPMTELSVPDGVEVHPGSGSEHLMPIFCMEQYRGIPAGEAMMRAKLEYFNTFRHMEHDDFSLATMMMFSLYGNPILRLQRNDEVLHKAEQMHVLPELPLAGKNWRDKLPIRKKKIYRMADFDSHSILADIRAEVDANLAAIHNQIQQNLYSEFGLAPENLHHVDAYTIPNVDGTLEKGYIYAYFDKLKTYANKTWVEVSQDGEMKRLITTK